MVDFILLDVKLKDHNIQHIRLMQTFNCTKPPSQNIDVASCCAYLLGKVTKLLYMVITKGNVLRQKKIILMFLSRSQGHCLCRIDIPYYCYNTNNIEL